MSRRPLSSSAPGVALLWVVALGGGCGGGTGAAPGSSTYVVPGSPPASYPIEPASVDRKDAQLKVAYSLPALLVGASQRVSLEGSLDGAGRYASVSGAAGTGQCDTQPGGGLSLRCDEHLTGITVDLAKVQALATQLDPATAADKVAVAARFAGEPIGVLEVR